MYVEFPIRINIDIRDRWVFYPAFILTMTAMYLNFWQFWSNGWVGTFYAEGIRTFNINLFTLPLLYWIGILTYLQIGEHAFIILGFTFFTISLFFLMRTFKDEYPLIAMFLFFFIFLRVESANWLMNFSRDAMLFMIACTFTYYFSKVWLKRENHYLKLLLLATVAVYTKSSGLLLLWFTFIIWVRNNHNRIFENSMLASIPLWRENWAYKAWLVDLQRMVNSLLDMRHFDSAYLFPNPVFYLSLISACILRKFTPIMIVLTSLLVGVAVHNISTQFYDLEVVWRYSFILLPINLLVIGEALKKVVVFGNG